MESDWNTPNVYRTIPQMEASPVKSDEVSEEHWKIALHECDQCVFSTQAKELEPAPPKTKYESNNMFAQSIFDLTLITINICQLCYVLKVGTDLGILYYIMAGLLGVSLFLLVCNEIQYFLFVLSTVIVLLFFSLSMDSWDFLEDYDAKFHSRTDVSTVCTILRCLWWC